MTAVKIYTSTSLPSTPLTHNKLNKRIHDCSEYIKILSKSVQAFLDQEEHFNKFNKSKIASVSNNQEQIKQKKKISKRGKPKNPVTQPSVTEYFNVVKRTTSTRKCKSQLEYEKQIELENKILSKCEDGLKIVQIEGKGRGIIAEKQFLKGDFVVEYAGDLITPKEAKKRDSVYKTDTSIGCYMYYFELNGKNYCVDATKETDRKGRLVNHSCKVFNCKTKSIWIAKTKEAKLILVACRDIKPGDEILYDYGERDKEALKAHPWLKD